MLRGEFGGGGEVGEMKKMKLNKNEI